MKHVFTQSFALQHHSHQFFEHFELLLDALNNELSCDSILLIVYVFVRLQAVLRAFGGFVLSSCMTSVYRIHFILLS